MVSELYSWMCDGKCHSLLLTIVTIIMLLNVELNEALYIYRLDYPVALITFFVALREDDQSWFWAFIWQIQVYGISSGYNHWLIVLLDRVVECVWKKVEISAFIRGNIYLYYRWRLIWHSGILCIWETLWPVLCPAGVGTVEEWRSTFSRRGTMSDTWFSSRKTYKFWCR